MIVGKGRSSFRPDVQGLRGVAVLAVVAYHANLPVRGGFLGVDVFFVISGFVITLTILGPLKERDSFNLAQFARARFWRLAPALGVALVGVTVLSALILSPLGGQQEAFKTAIATGLGVSNFWLARSVGDYFGPDAAVNPLLNAWSLSVEQQFYLMFALALAAIVPIARRKSTQMGKFAGLLAFTALISLGIMLFSSQLPAVVPQWIVGFFSPFPRAWEFAAGAFAALVVQRLDSGGKVPPVWLSAPMAVVGAGLVIASFVIAPSAEYPNAFTLIPVVGTVIVIWTGSVSETPVRKLLQVGPLKSVGDISYSWYLWHWPLIVFAVVLFPTIWLAPISAAIVSMVVAVASYRFLEVPFRKRSHTNLAGSTRWAVTFGVVPIVLALLALVLVDRGYLNEELAAQQAAVLPVHLGAASGCAGGQSTLADPAKCTWNSGASGRPIYLIGDSNAEQFSEAVVQAGAEQSRPVTILTQGGCPPFPLDIRRADTPESWAAWCKRYVATTLNWLLDSPPGTVILGFSDRIWTDPVDQIGLPDSQLTSDREGKLRILENSLSQEVSILQRSGHQVVVILPIPHFASPERWSPAQCSLFVTLQGTCGASMKATDFAAQQADVLRAITTGAAKADAVVDLLPRLCPNSVCSTDVNGVFLYRDGDHLSVEATPLVVPAFLEALGKPLPQTVP